MEKLYTCEEIAERYSVNAATVKEWIRRKELSKCLYGHCRNAVERMIL